MFLATAMELFEFEELTISEWALREGIVLDAIGRHDPDDWSDDPPRHPPRVGAGLARRCSLARGPLAPGRDARARALRPDPRAARARRRRPRAARVRARCCTTSASTSSHEGHHRHARVPRRARPAARASPPTRSRCSPRSCASTAAASPKAIDDLVGRSTTTARPGPAARRAPPPRRRPRPQPQAGRSSAIDAQVSPSLVLLRLHADDDAELELWGARRKRELFEKVFDRELELTAHPAADRASSQGWPVTVW